MTKWKSNLAVAAMLVSLAALLLSWRNDRPSSRASSAEESSPADSRQGWATGDRPMPDPFSPQVDRTELARAMLERVTHSLPLTEEEQKLVDSATSRKLEARRPLEEQRLKLAEMAVETRWTDEQIQSALDDLLVLKEEVDRQVQDIDRELIASVSTRARAHLYVTGMVGNGLVIKAQIESTGPSPEMMESMRAMMSGTNPDSMTGFPPAFPRGGQPPLRLAPNQETSVEQ